MDEIDQDLINTKGTCEAPKGGKGKPWDGHTKLPWCQARSRARNVVSYGNGQVCFCSEFEPIANAALIVHRVNTYDALVEALHQLCGDVEAWAMPKLKGQNAGAMNDAIADAQKVLKLATGN